VCNKRRKTSASKLHSPPTRIDRARSDFLLEGETREKGGSKAHTLEERKRNSVCHPLTHEKRFKALRVGFPVRTNVQNGQKLCRGEKKTNVKEITRRKLNKGGLPPQLQQGREATLTIRSPFRQRIKAFQQRKKAGIGKYDKGRKLERFHLLRGRVKESA